MSKNLHKMYIKRIFIIIIIIHTPVVHTRRVYINIKERLVYKDIHTEDDDYYYV